MHDSSPSVIILLKHPLVMSIGYYGIMLCYQLNNKLRATTIVNSYVTKAVSGIFGKAVFIQMADKS